MKKTQLIAMIITGMFFSSCSDEKVSVTTEKVSTVSSHRNNDSDNQGNDGKDNKETKEVKKLIEDTQTQNIVPVDLSDSLEGSTITIEPGTFTESFTIEVKTTGTLISEDYSEKLSLGDDTEEISDAVNISFENDSVKTIPVPMTVSLQINDQGLSLTGNSKNIFVIYSFVSESGEKSIGTIGQQDVEVDGGFAIFKTSLAGTYQLARSLQEQDSVEVPLVDGEAKIRETEEQTPAPVDTTIPDVKEEGRILALPTLSLSEGEGAGEVLGRIFVEAKVDYFFGFVSRKHAGDAHDCLASEDTAIFKFSSNEGHEFLFLDRSDKENTSLDYKVCVFDAARSLIGGVLQSFTPPDKTLPPMLTLTSVWSHGEKEVPSGSHGLSITLPEDIRDIAVIQVVKLRSSEATSCEGGEAISEFAPNVKETFIQSKGTPGEQVFLGVCTYDTSKNLRFQMHSGYYRMDHLIIISGLVTGNIGSLEKADSLCEQTGNSALNGVSFKAVLSDSGHKINARDRFRLKGYVRTFNGETFATPETLWSGEMRNPVLFNGKGEQFFDQDRVFTGTKSDGTASGLDCKSWTSASNEASGSVGSRSGTGKSWVEGENVSCDESRFLYCVSESTVDFGSLVIPQ